MKGTTDAEAPRETFREPVEVSLASIILPQRTVGDVPSIAGRQRQLRNVPGAIQGGLAIDLKLQFDAACVEYIALLLMETVRYDPIRLLRHQMMIVSKSAICAIVCLLIGPAVAWAQGIAALPAELKAAEAVCDMKIVVLGELPSHGEARAFSAKARIVEQLVKQCGFGAIFFEAPIYDFLGLREAIADDLAEPQQLDDAIGGFWLTDGLSAWRAWLFSQAIEGSIILGGMDDQVSATSEYARATLPDLIAASFPPKRAAECRRAIERNLFWRYDAENGYDGVERALLQQCAHLAADALAARKEGDQDTTQEIMATNLANLYGRQVQSTEAVDRDDMMYQNVRRQSEWMPDETKIIVWTATVHAARQQGARENKPLGTWLSEQWGDQMASIGFSAFAGESSMAGMPSRSIPDAPPGSLEALATDSDTTWTYLNASALNDMGVVPSRLFGRITSADWSEYFDGVLVIREEIAPVFDNR